MDGCICIHFVVGYGRELGIMNGTAETIERAILRYLASAGYHTTMPSRLYFVVSLPFLSALTEKLLRIVSLLHMDYFSS